MTLELKMELNLDGIQNKTVKKALKELGEKLLSDFSDNIESITVTGSALTGDYVEGKSDINTVLVFKEHSLNLLDGIGNMGRLLVKNRFHMPLIMTPDYISRSCDVFGVEYLDFQLNHNTIFGAEPFNSLLIEKQDVRLQCEREFKANMIRLRQGYVASQIGSAKLVEILAGCGGALMPYLRAMLWLNDFQRDPLISTTISQAASQFGFDGNMLEKIVSWKYQKADPDKNMLREALDYLYRLIDKLAEKADEFQI
jgi:hypothetical protein